MSAAGVSASADTTFIGRMMLVPLIEGNVEAKPEASDTRIDVESAARRPELGIAADRGPEPELGGDVDVESTDPDHLVSLDVDRERLRLRADRHALRAEVQRGAGLRSEDVERSAGRRQPGADRSRRMERRCLCARNRRNAM